MLPRQMERLQDQLINWGYSPRIVELMEPWSLLSHYNNQLKKRENLLLNDNVDDEIFINTDELKEEYNGKYKGVIVPYRL